MKITTYREWKINQVVDGHAKDYYLPSGVYEGERIKNPAGKNPTGMY